jgi:hypothetical protein
MLALTFACHLFSTATVECVEGQRCADPNKDDSKKTDDSQPDDSNPDDSSPADSDSKHSEPPPNTAPEIRSVTLSPSEPGMNDSITVTVDATDADGDSLSYSYSWILNGQASSAPDRDTLSSGNHVPGDKVSVQVTVSDGRDQVSSGSSEVVVGGPSFVRMVHRVNMEVDSDYTAGTGSWSFSLYSEGKLLGHLDCSPYYELSSTGTSNCPSCDFNFSMRASLDSSLSSYVTGCDEISTSGRINTLFTTYYYGYDHLFEVRNESSSGVYFPLHIMYYNTYYQPYYADYNYYFGMKVLGDGSQSSPTYISRYSVDSWKDNNSILHIYAYSYRMLEYNSGR